MGVTSSRVNELKSLKPYHEPSNRPIGHATSLMMGGLGLSSIPLGVFELPGLQWLGAWSMKLTSLSAEISRLTRLTLLGVNDNLISSIPSEISTLTNLVYFDVNNNPIDELPAQITALSRLQTLRVNNGSGQVIIKRAPIGITELPCWSNEADVWGGLSVSESLRGLSLYETDICMQNEETLIAPLNCIESSHAGEDGFNSDDTVRMLPK